MNCIDQCIFPFALGQDSHRGLLMADEAEANNKLQLKLL